MMGPKKQFNLGLKDIQILQNIKIMIEKKDIYLDIKKMKIGPNQVFRLQGFGLVGYCGINQVYQLL